MDNLLSGAKNVSASETFLTAMGRNSTKSKTAYDFALKHFQTLMVQSYPGYNIETILKPLVTNQINVYDILEHFVAYLVALKPTLSPNSIKSYMAAVRSYLQYNDIDIIPAKFRRKVKMPRLYREDEEALDVVDVRKILLACNNRRLKSYLLVLASGGVRAVEGFSIRLCDINFTVNPTRIHIRKEFTKTKVARDIYITDEATQYLKQWIDYKYNDPSRKKQRIRQESDLIFTVYQKARPEILYVRGINEFHKLLDIVGLGSKKDGTRQVRRKITFHSLRRFVKTVISNQVNKDYSEWFLGHIKSPYYTTKEPERRQIYLTKCMKYLTFLDYTALETSGKTVEAKLDQKDIQMQSLQEQIITLQKGQKELLEMLASKDDYDQNVKA